MFLWNVLQQNFYNFLPELSEFGFWLEGLRLAIKSKFSRDFLEISLFSKILSFKSLVNLRGNLYSHFLVIWLRLTCGDGKLY